MSNTSNNINTGIRGVKTINYVGFPSFKEWAKSAIDKEQWRQVMEELKGDLYSDILLRIRLIIKNAFLSYSKENKSFDTESVSLLFRTMNKFILPSSDVNNNLSLENQFKIYNYIMDLMENDKYISKRSLCKLHYLICNIRQIQIYTGSKIESSTFAGKYKNIPNKIGCGKDSILGVPLNRTHTEMLKYFQELRSKQFLEAHPVLQASYAHYALVAIHPFADGNGRVARLLSFYFIYRSNSIPIFFLNQNYSRYISTLREADLGDYQLFVNLVQERAIDSASAIKEQISLALQFIDEPLNTIK